MGQKATSKKRSARKAVEYIEDNFVLGLGTGSTATYAIQEIGKRIKKEKMKILGVPTSRKTSILAIRCGIPLTTLDRNPVLDLGIDGADQIDKNLDLIKGMGGALTREKIVAEASKKMLIVADKTKLTDVLGRNQPLPLEVLPFALSFIILKIEKMKGRPVIRKEEGGSRPYITDNGNYILDVDFGIIENPHQLNQRLKDIPGVIETGLFLGMVDIVCIGTDKNVRILLREK